MERLGFAARHRRAAPRPHRQGRRGLQLDARAAPCSPDDNQRLVVACGKCSNGREFKTFAAVLDQERMIYRLDPQFNVAEWEQGMHNAGGRESDPLDTLLAICATPCTRSEARRQLEQSGLSRAASYKAINRAIEEAILIVQGDKLALAE